MLFSLRRPVREGGHTKDQALTRLGCLQAALDRRHAPHIDPSSLMRRRTSLSSVRPASNVRLGSVPTSAEDDLSFLQSRLALYGLTVAVLAGLFMVVGAIAHVAAGDDFLAAANRRWHLLATALAAGVWLVARRRSTYSLATLQELDTIGTLAICASFVVMAHAIPGVIGSLVGTLAVSYTTLCRAAQVPSTPGRTLVLSAFSFAGLFVIAAIQPVPAGYPEGGLGRFFALLDPLLWCVTGTALATVASKVIYGLQEKALEARQLGQYTLEAKIGQGGMGEIYRARHAMLRRPTAIKLLAGEHSEAQLRGFEREVQLTASLRHPNTICVYDFGRTPEGTFYYAMELLDGLNLETLVERHGPQPPGRVVNILLQVCGALGEAHGVGLIHRDIKPANIYLCRQGGIDDFVKVLDFGLVRELSRDVSLSLSSQQALVGTPLYMSPEAIASPDRLDARADLYGLGATAYHLLTGSPPFNGASLVEVCGHHLNSTPERPSARLGRPLAESLENIVLRCLAKNPAERPQSARVLEEELRAAAGIPAFTAEDALRFWETDFVASPSESPLSFQRTVHVAFGRRTLERSEDFPRSA